MVIHLSQSRLIALFLIIVAATALHAQAEVPGNLLANPGFEETLEGFPAGWSTFDAKARSLVAIDGREVFAGRYSLRVTGDPGESWAPLFSGSVKTDPGGEYTLGCYAKTQLKPATGSITFALREISDAGQSLRFAHVQIPHQSDWAFYSNTFKLSDKTVAVQVFIVLQKCEGTMWLDDLALVKGPLPNLDQLKSRQKQPASAAAAPEVPLYANLLPNNGLDTLTAAAPARSSFAGSAGQTGQSDETFPFAGSRAFRQTHAASGLPGSYLHPAAPTPLDPNAFYRLSGWVRTSADSRSAWTSVPAARGQRVEGASLQLLFLDSQRQLVSQVWSVPVQTNGQWQQLAVVGRAPGNAAFADARLFHGDLRGASWFDALRLERLATADDLQPLWALPADAYAPGALPPTFRFTGAGSASLAQSAGADSLTLALKSPGTLTLPPVDASYPGTFRVTGECRKTAGDGQARLILRSLSSRDAVLSTQEIPLSLSAQWITFSADYTPHAMATRFTAELVLTGNNLALELRQPAVQQSSRLTIDEYAKQAFPASPTIPSPANKPPQITFAPRLGVPSLSLGGQLTPLSQYWYTDPPRPETVEAARRAGLIQTVSFADVDWSKDPGVVDFASVDAQVRAVLKQDPNAWIMLCPDTSGEMGKDSWVKHHPEQAYVDETAARAIQSYGGEEKLFPSFASTEWLAAMNQMLSDVIAHVKQSDYAGRVIGYQLSGYEWFQWGYGAAHMDYSTHVRDAFRRWLKTRYVTPERLQEAWGKPAITFEGVEIPTPAERKQTVDGVFRDPLAGRSVTDFSRFYNELIAEALISQARTVRKATGPQTLVSCYYGYAAHFFDSQTRETAGHLGVRKLLESGLFAISGGPTDGYMMERALGGTGGFMTLPGSYPLHGLLYLDQPDFRTHWSGQEIERTVTITEDVSLYQREFALALTNDTPIQYLDWQRGWTMGDPRLVEEIRRYGEIERFAQTLDRKAPAEGMAIVFSEEAADFLGTDRTLFDGGILYHQRPLFFRSGMPHRYYLLSDLANASLPDYKLWVFPNAFRLTESERALIQRKCLRNGNVALFVYAPGIVDEKTVSVGNMEKLLGMKLEKLSDQREALVTISANAKCPWLQDSPDLTYGQSQWSPLYAVADPTAVALGTWTGTDRVGLAMKDFGSYRVVYSGTGMLPPDLLRDVGRLAGANIYCDTSDAVYADANFVGLHARTPGTKRLHLPRRADVYDLLNRKVLARNVDTMNLEMQAFETSFLYIGEAAKAERFFARP
jgi:hypothetical protein